MKHQLLFALALCSEIALGCEAMNAAQLAQKLPKDKAEQLIFFASWCGSCRKHLTQDYLEKSLFIAGFDEQAAATKVFDKFLGAKHRDRCVWDADGSIVAAYGVKSLPAERPAKQPPASGK